MKEDGFLLSNRGANIYNSEANTASSAPKYSIAILWKIWCSFSNICFNIINIGKINIIFKTSEAPLIIGAGFNTPASIFEGASENFKKFIYKTDLTFFPILYI